MRTFALAALIGALIAGGSATAAPHGAAPTYVTSDPEPGEQRETAPDKVTITFSEPLDDSSRALVLDACDRRIDDRASEVFANELTIGISTTPAGQYRVFYEATGVGGATGTTRGAFGFEVTSGPNCGGHGGHTDHGNGGGQHGGGQHGDGDDHSGEGGHGGSGGGHQGEHVAAPGDHDGHSGTMDGAHSDHPGGKTNGGRGDQVEAGELQAQPRAEVDLTAAPGSPEADSAALVLGLGLAAAIGVLGGWFLRVSRPS